MKVETMGTQERIEEIQNRIRELEGKQAKVKEEIEKETAAVRRWQIVKSAYGKFCKVGLTPEEKAAVNGMYLFLHIDLPEIGWLHVDLVRGIPSATDKGQGKKLEKVLALGEKVELEVELDGLYDLE